MKYKNTLQKGSVRFIIFKEDATWYGVCLEFNIVEEGSTPQEAYMLLNEAAQGYVESARKIKARPHILNQVSDCEYESLWSKLQGAEDQKEKMPSVFSFGKINLNQLRNNASAPAWLFMSKGVFNWTAEEVVRFLKDRGFSLNHSRGSHLYYVGHANGSFRQVSVPFHGARAIKPRTMKGIILQSGIEKSEWLRK